MQANNATQKQNKVALFSLHCVLTCAIIALTKGDSMQVYIVQGLGFGDNENEWDMCNVYATQVAADAAATEILRSSGLDADYVRVVVADVLT